MLILDDDRLEGMRCSRCRKYLSVFPVKNHPKSRDVTCGRCSRYDDDDGGVPSALYELVAVEYLFRCVNRYEGCGKLLRVDETEAHERRCVGGTFRCTKCKDGAEKSALELTWHYKIEHPSSYLHEKNRFDARPQTADVKLYVRDDVFAFVLVHYGPNALHLAAATLTEVDVSQEFSVSKGERLWERTERRPCKAIGAYDVDHYVVDMDPPTSVEVTFDLVASKGAGLYDVSVPRPIKKAIADASKGKTFRVQTAEDIEGMFGYKLNDRGMALLNSAGKEIDLNCSNCKHLIGLYIYRCVKANHQLCHDCRAWCGICDDGQVQVPTSCELLRAISRLLKFPCRWKCGAYFTAYLRKHERSCESRIFKCPMCSFAVNWSNLTLIKDHLETDHGISNFLGDYDWWRIKLFLRQKVKGELSFMYNDKCCYLRWARDGNGPYYDLYFGLYRNEPNVQMAFIDVESGRKYLNVIRAAPQDSWSYSPYINFGHKK